MMNWLKTWQEKLEWVFGAAINQGPLEDGVREMLDTSKDLVVFNGYARKVMDVRDALAAANLADRIEPSFRW